MSKTKSDQTQEEQNENGEIGRTGEPEKEPEFYRSGPKPAGEFHQEEKDRDTLDFFLVDQSQPSQPQASEPDAEASPRHSETESPPQVLCTGETMVEFNHRLSQQGLFSRFTQHCRNDANRYGLPFSAIRERLAGFYGLDCPAGEGEARVAQGKFNEEAGQLTEVSEGMVIGFAESASPTTEATTPRDGPEVSGQLQTCGKPSQPAGGQIVYRFEKPPQDLSHLEILQWIETALGSGKQKWELVYPSPAAKGWYDWAVDDRAKFFATLLAEARRAKAEEAKAETSRNVALDLQVAEISEMIAEAVEAVDKKVADLLKQKTTKS